MLLCSYVLVAITGPDHPLLGSTTAGTLEAHLKGVGNTIRMVMGHFIELKRCPHAKEVAFRKARFYKFGLSVLILIGSYI